MPEIRSLQADTPGATLLGPTHKDPVWQIWGLAAGRGGTDAPRHTTNRQGQERFKRPRSQWKPWRSAQGAGRGGGGAPGKRAPGRRNRRTQEPESARTRRGGVARVEQPPSSSSATLPESLESPPESGVGERPHPRPLPAVRPPGGRAGEDGGGARLVGWGPRALGLVPWPRPPLLRVGRGRSWRGLNCARPSPAGCGNGAAGFKLGTFPSILDAPRRSKVLLVREIWGSVTLLGPIVPARQPPPSRASFLRLFDR